MTPLLSAANDGKMEGIPLLLEAGADLEARDKVSENGYVYVCMYVYMYELLKTHVRTLWHLLIKKVLYTYIHIYIHTLP